MSPLYEALTVVVPELFPVTEHPSTVATELSDELHLAPDVTSEPASLTPLVMQ